MNSTQVAVDLAKSVFQVAISTVPGRVDEQRRLSRERFRRFFAERRATEVLMEACGTAHHWGRELEALGHRVRLLPPADVARYRDGNKTDRADAIALLEASRNERIDAVPVKTLEQQALTSLHRLRSAYVADRTARINTVRGILREFGHAIPQGARHVRRPCPRRARRRAAARPLRHELALCARRDRGLQAEDPRSSLSASRRSATRCPTSSTCARSQASACSPPPRSSRSSASPIASAPAATSRPTSGSRPGRTHPASGDGSVASPSEATPTSACCSSTARAPRCSLPARTEEPDALQRWALRVELRCGHNKATVALANRLARIAWRVWQRSARSSNVSPESGLPSRGGRH